MPIRPPQPPFIESIMDTRPLRHGSPQPLRMRMRDPRGVIAAAAQTPRNDVLHIEDLPLAHPLEDGVPEPLGALRVFGIGGAVGRARDFGDDGRPAASEELVRPLRVIRTVSVEAGDQEDRRDWSLRGRGDGDADV